jgi:hypothetical protein
MKKFHLNEIVLVKLKDEGYKILSEQWNSIAETSPSLSKRSPEYYKGLADENGYTKFQAWEFIATLGPHTNLGLIAPFDTTILIDDRFLESI